MNLRPPVPQTGALTGLRYAPNHIAEPNRLTHGHDAVPAKGLRWQPVAGLPPAGRNPDPADDASLVPVPDAGVNRLKGVAESPHP